MGDYSIDRNGTFSDEDSACADMEPLRIATAIEIAVRWAKDEVAADVNRGGATLADGTAAHLGRAWPLGWRSRHAQHYLRFWNAVRRDVAAWIAARMPEEQPKCGLDGKPEVSHGIRYIQVVGEFRPFLESGVDRDGLGQSIIRQIPSKETADAETTISLHQAVTI
jgi:hypothetical protein